MSRPAAWPVLVAYLVALGTTVVASQELVLAVGRHHGGHDPAAAAAQASQFALSVPGLASVAVLDAVVLSLCAIATARLLYADAAADGLRVIGGQASPIGIVASMAGVAGLSLAGGTLAGALGVGPDIVSRAIEAALRSAGPTLIALAVVSLAIAPALAEETFFRGLMQTRLVASFGRWPGIVGASAAFGAMHLGAVQGSLAFVVGLLLGWIAERFGSIWPAIFAHATNNALFIVLAIALPSHDPHDAPASGGLRAGVTFGVGVGLTLGALAVLRAPLALRASTRAS